MERGRAIIELSDFLEDTEVLFDSFTGTADEYKALCDKLAYRILDYVEQDLGMLPPQCKDFHISDFFERRKFYARLHNCRKWDE